MILCDFIKIPQSFFLFQKNDSSLYKGACDGRPLRSSVNFILYVICCEQPQGLSLRYDIKFTSHSFKRFCHKHGVFGRVGIKIFSQSHLREAAFSVKSDCVFVRLSNLKRYKLGVFFTADFFKLL